MKKSKKLETPRPKIILENIDLVINGGCLTFLGMSKPKKNRRKK